MTDRLFLVCGAAMAATAGVALAASNWLALGIVSAVLVVPLLSHARGRGRGGSRPASTAVEKAALAALWLALASTWVLRVRTSADLGSNPLDGAGLYRLGALAAAGLLAGLVVRQHRGTPAGRWGPVRMYVVYVLAILPAVVVAVNPGLVLFRFAELSVFLAVWYATHLAFAGDQRTVFRHLGAYLLALCVVLALNAALVPEALVPARGGLLPWRLQSVYPGIAVNTVGFFGVLLFCFGLAGGRWRIGALGVGVALLVLTQYRTGYVALVVVGLVWLLATRHPLSRLGLIAAAPALGLVVRSERFGDVWARGESAELVGTLNSRTLWWEAALDAWARSPFVGTGLSSGTRFEVFGDLSVTSSVHSTWVEALVGTGLLGVLPLATAAAASLLVALRVARSGGPVLPLLVLVALLVRSITASTIELGGVLVPFFLAAASWAAHERRSAGDQQDTRSQTASPNSAVPA